MNKFTPGPWFFVEDIRDESDGFTYIAGYDIKSNSAEIVGCEGISGDSDENLANARLIAAAPDLLEALEKAREDINWMINTGQQLNAHCFDYICAAIASARGEA
jgi:hypothetical protein